MFLRKQFVSSILIVMLSFASADSAGTVYLVLGSDTAIWDGMNTGRYHCTYNSDLYTNPAMNGYAVMDPAWRLQLVDSYGTPMKLTWWMMAGNIFRYATNRNMPIPNIMTMYFMKKYHSDHIQQYGDELTLHYHTFYWSDYDQDGIYYWNQSLTFLECLDDFDVTIAQFLLEEQVFPVSFRSGWHYMDNDWQHYLDKMLPYSMHNDWPAKRTDTTEPLDNTFDWSLAPSEFVPWHPSEQNYQLPGDGPGWNVRSAHLNRVRYKDLMDTVFAAAANGTDQVACFWGHLPETDFITNLEIMDSLAHKADAKYPGVNFRYCTAIEAMQRWLGTYDSIPPQLSFDHLNVAGHVYFRIESNEPLFQDQPFVAIKDINENYSVLWCQQTGVNQWETTQGVAEDEIAKAGIALTDTVGNQSMKFINFLPDDIFTDNQDAGYQEITGNWSSVEGDYWDLEYRLAEIPVNDSAVVRWSPEIYPAGQYNVFYQPQVLDNPAQKISFKVFENFVCVDTVVLEWPYQEKEWNYVATAKFRSTGNDYIEMKTVNNTSVTQYLSADVLKLSGLVRDRKLVLPDELVSFGAISEDDTAAAVLRLQNLGINPITVSNIQAQNNLFIINQSFPFTVNAMSISNVDIKVYADDPGVIEDTLVIQSNDPDNPVMNIPVRADVQKFFKIVDNEDSENYAEWGEWHYSVAQAYGPTSRYAYLNNGYSAAFYINVEKNGLYDIYEIVPKTVNSSDKALYIISADGIPVDSVYINQNEGSGAWVHIGQFLIPGESEIEIKVVDTGESTNGPVIRADAVKISLFEEVSGIGEDNLAAIPRESALQQNYPNPFNPVTTIRYQLADNDFTTIKIYNMLGQEITTLLSENQKAGFYQIKWDASGFASGVYFYLLETSSGFSEMKKMVVLR